MKEVEERSRLDVRASPNVGFHVLKYANLFFALVCMPEEVGSSQVECMKVDFSERSRLEQVATK